MNNRNNKTSVNRRGNKKNNTPFNKNNNNRNNLQNRLSNRRILNRNIYNDYEDDLGDDEIDENGNPSSGQQQSSRERARSSRNISRSYSNSSNSISDDEVDSEDDDNHGGIVKFKIPIKVVIIIIAIFALIIIFGLFLIIICAAIASIFGGTLEFSGIGDISGAHTTSPDASLSTVVDNPCPVISKLINCRKSFNRDAGEELPNGAELCKVNNNVSSDVRYYFPDKDVIENVPFEKYVAGVVTGEVGGFGNISVGQAFAVASRTDGILYARNSVSNPQIENCSIEYSNRTQVYSPPSNLGITSAKSTDSMVLKNSNNELIGVQMFYDAFACGQINGSKIVTIKGKQYYIINQPILTHQLIPKEFADSYVPEKWRTCDKTSHHGDGASQYGAYYLAKEKHFGYEDIINYYYGDYKENRVESNSFNCYSLFDSDRAKCNGSVHTPDLDALYLDVIGNSENENYIAEYGWPSIFSDVPKPSFSNYIWYESENSDEASIYVYDCSKSDAIQYINTIKSSGFNIDISEDDEDSYYEEGYPDDYNREELLIEFTANNANGDDIFINYSSLSGYLTINIDRYS